jgi:hypothetical protein
MVRLLQTTSGWIGKMVWLITNWRIVAKILGAGLAVALTLLVNSWRVDAGKLAAAETALAASIAQCAADKQVTTEVSRDYQKNLAALRSRLAAHRVQPDRCIAVARTPTGHDAASGAGVATGSNGVSSGALIEYAGDAEQYRLQLIACQQFVLKERENFR